MVDFPKEDINFSRSKSSVIGILSIRAPDSIDRALISTKTVKEGKI